MTRRGDESGFTVIELVMAMVVTLIISVPLVSSFVLGVTVTQRTDRDVTNSADAQVATSFFNDDVAGAEAIGVSSGCGGSGTVLHLRSSRAAGAVQHVAYRAVADAGVQAEIAAPGSVYRLERVVCPDVSGPASAPVVVGRALRALPTVRCDGGACSPATTRPRTVSLEVTEFGRPASDPAADYSFTVTATRKVSP